MKLILAMFIFAALAVSCGGEGDSNGSEGGSESITISGTMGTSKSQDKAIDLSSIKMYCVAFNSAASSGQSDFGSDGSFSLSIPANTPFGCFVVAKSDLSIVATLKVEDSGSGMEDESSSAMNLGSSVSLGSITIEEGNPVVSVPKSRIESAQSTSDDGPLEISDFHNTTWTLTCVDSNDTACADFVSESPQVYFRILEATKGSATINGLGVWASSSAFSACGSIDMTADEATGIATSEGGGFSWVQNTTDTTFSNNTTDSSFCASRDATGDGTDHENIQAYYTMSKLVNVGGMYSINDEEEEIYQSDNCYYYHKTAVTFSPSSSTVMYGSIDSVEVLGNMGSCSDDQIDDKASFVVKFTKQ